jgi:hypothetical protein
MAGTVLSVAAPAPAPAGVAVVVVVVALFPVPTSNDDRDRSALPLLLLLLLSSGDALVVNIIMMFLRGLLVALLLWILGLGLAPFTTLFCSQYTS